MMFNSFASSTNELFRPRLIVGGKPSKGTPKDKRLKENRRRSKVGSKKVSK